MKSKHKTLGQQEAAAWRKLAEEIDASLYHGSQSRRNGPLTPIADSAMREGCRPPI